MFYFGGPKVKHNWFGSHEHESSRVSQSEIEKLLIPNEAEYFYADLWLLVSWKLNKHGPPDPPDPNSGLLLDLSDFLEKIRFFGLGILRPEAPTPPGHGIAITY